MRYILTSNSIFAETTQMRLPIEKASIIGIQNCNVELHSDMLFLLNLKLTGSRIEYLIRIPKKFLHKQDMNKMSIQIVNRSIKPKLIDNSINN